MKSNRWNKSVILYFFTGLALFGCNQGSIDESEVGSNPNQISSDSSSQSSYTVCDNLGVDLCEKHDGCFWDGDMQGCYPCEDISFMDDCELYSDRCRFFYCDFRCHAKNLEPDSICSPDMACLDYYSKELCTAHSDFCFILPCADRCFSLDIDPNLVCSGCLNLFNPSECLDSGKDDYGPYCEWSNAKRRCFPFDTPLLSELDCYWQSHEECLKHLESCAWDPCANACVVHSDESTCQCQDFRTEGECTQNSDRCAWASCSKKCLPILEAQPELLCGCSGYQSAQECNDHYLDCAWSSCANACVPRYSFNPFEKYCGCEQYQGADACNQHRGTCAWYECGQLCLPEGVPIVNACGCQAFPTIESCNQNNPYCAWYSCDNSCYPSGNPKELFCN